MGNTQKKKQTTSYPQGIQRQLQQPMPSFQDWLLTRYDEVVFDPKRHIDSNYRAFISQCMNLTDSKKRLEKLTKRQDIILYANNKKTTSAGCLFYLQNCGSRTLCVRNLASNELLSHCFNMKIVEIDQINFKIELVQVAPKLYKFHNLVALRVKGVEPEFSVGKVSLKRSIQYLEQLIEFGYHEKEHNAQITFQVGMENILIRKSTNFSKICGFDFPTFVKSGSLSLKTYKEESILWYLLFSRDVEVDNLKIIVEPEAIEMYNKWSIFYSLY